mmetsp:Transcript_15962/g.28660  ORF Transcript_15962/g.28660 Transcript_15962/m.28660 type:complete len:369 (-) Transcript_15962:795-1901(-)|eukprot:CAMPEP_0175083584 /NCGR_PEP_ID=MMETSP0052_2-20121109/27483_1 /TAXON_ID=51329 ORGANISM="Polytomella parva, Strain SAG 63-3" /NCGR_SAMPLE_ID=MMETSP0052_2 /ASSEMBLY_ACC=CAM_ASM_000194 /LENGTH=368 /DNA_ID=CAMNT_0016355089 /DNA_START=41 /DNA_END=1147 /DNA_ORIENTATION=-
MSLDKEEVFQQFCNEDKTLPLDKLMDFLGALNIKAAEDEISTSLSILVGQEGELKPDQAFALCAMLTTSPSTRAPAAEPSDSDCRTPLKKVLTKNRYYLETGNLAFDPAVVQYLNKLEEHKKKCEVEGRYQEAKVVAKRLADLKAAQVEKTRTDLVASQIRELQDVQRAFEEESVTFDAKWIQRINEFEISLNSAVDALRLSHSKQLVEMVEDQQKRRPLRARVSKDYLHHRAIQDKLGRAGEYNRAARAKEIADELYKSDLDQTLAGWEADCRLRITKLQAKQQQEADSLRQRGSKGRDAMLLRKAQESERRAQRLRNVVTELESLHRLEIVHLENFLDAQALAGKTVPLKDGFRRKREQILSTEFA